MTAPPRSVALAALIALVAWSPVAAQGTPAANTGDIRGRVADAATKAAIGTATVDVTITGVTAPATPARATTGADGGFHVRGLRPGRYRVRIVAIGYTPRVLASVAISASSPSTDVGTVTLTASTVQLQKVVVTDGNQEVQLTPDRNVYRVRDMPSSKGGTAIDVLRNVPSVDVDIDNVVSLRGNSGVVVQINGRPSPLKPAQLGNFLAQLPADMVEKVEVIPNPSARDDPDGVAGIINIVLKQEPDAGTSGGLTTGAGTTGRVDVGANIGYQRGPLSLYGSYGYFRDDRPRTESIYRENRYRSPLTILEETGARSQFQNGQTVTGTAGYRLAKHDELSLDVLLTARDETESNGILYRDENASRAVTGLSDRVIDGTNHRFNFESALAYKHAFAAKGHKFSSEIRFATDQESGPVRVTARSLTPAGAPAGQPALENQTALEHPDENSLKLDYAQPLSSRVRLEVGYKGSLQRFNTTQDTRVHDTVQAAYRPDSTRISDFTYDQAVHAVYGVLNAQLGKFLVQGGVRGEQATTQFHLNTVNATYDNVYNSVYPSGLIAYNVNDA